jgi:hypothetical protein
MAPVMRGMCHYESLLDGTLTLCDFARLNNTIACYDENARRMRDS